jgi:hypothetical protein
VSAERILEGRGVIEPDELDLRRGRRIGYAIDYGDEWHVRGIPVAPARRSVR